MTNKVCLFVVPGLLAIAALGCNFPALIVATETPTSSIPTFEPSLASPAVETSTSPLETEIVETQPPQVTPTLEPSPVSNQENSPEQSPTIQVPSQKEDAILILEPGPGSRVKSPLHISGVADSVFEQTLGIRLIQDDGTVLAMGPVFIESELGKRGPFSIDIPFEVSGEKQAVLQIFAASPRDGGVTHLASAGLLLMSSGEEQISQRDPQLEQILILQPEVSSTIRGGSAHVEGFALASFEQHLVVEIQDVDGKVIGSMPVTVQAPDVGLPGPFSVDVPYDLKSAGPGRIVVRDPSPAFDVDLHISSVEVNLEP